MSDTVLFSANRGYALTSSREAIIRRFLDCGWRVVLATADDQEARYLAGLGATLEPITYSRGGFAARADWRAWRRMQEIYRTWRPSLAHHFNAKPVMLGTLTARQILGGSASVLNTITGLGHAFVSGGIVARLAALGYRLALPRSDITIFQNRDDQQLFLDRGWVLGEQARLIAGSGVDLARFSYVDRVGRDSAPVVIMVGRLLRQKGIPEFAEVARRVQEWWPQTRFLLAGEEEPDHPNGLTADWACQQASIEYLGRLSDVSPFLAEADLMLFPSYYREGIPRAVMEAAASGVPTVAYNVPGVREAIRDGETGYLVPDRDIDKLYARVVQLLEDKNQRLEMSRSARQLAEEAFDIRIIQEQYFSVYRELGAAI